MTLTLPPYYWSDGYWSEGYWSDGYWSGQAVAATVPSGVKYNDVRVRPRLASQPIAIGMRLALKSDIRVRTRLRNLPIEIA